MGCWQRWSVQAYTRPLKNFTFLKEPPEWWRCGERALERLSGHVQSALRVSPLPARGTPKLATATGVKGRPWKEVLEEKLRCSLKGVITGTRASGSRGTSGKQWLILRFNDPGPGLSQRHQEHVILILWGQGCCVRFRWALRWSCWPKAGQEAATQGLHHSRQQ